MIWMDVEDLYREEEAVGRVRCDFVENEGGCECSEIKAIERAKESGLEGDEQPHSAFKSLLKAKESFSKEASLLDWGTDYAET